MPLAPSYKMMDSNGQILTEYASEVIQEHMLAQALHAHSQSLPTDINGPHEAIADLHHSSPYNSSWERSQEMILTNQLSRQSTTPFVGPGIRGRPRDSTSAMRTPLESKSTNKKIRVDHLNPRRIKSPENIVRIENSSNQSPNKAFPAQRGMSNCGIP
jgi:hypothetical protein